MTDSLGCKPAFLIPPLFSWRCMKQCQTEKKMKAKIQLFSAAWKKIHNAHFKGQTWRYSFWDRHNKTKYEKAENYSVLLYGYWHFKYRKAQNKWLNEGCKMVMSSFKTLPPKPINRNILLLCMFKGMCEV